VRLRHYGYPWVLMSLLSELKRRNVFRVAVMYLAVSWLVL
jgi:hypothetical protein